jgi:2-oxoglutarate dehydrogenase E2 component (dihydrolipoamide succinyltransferase)
MPTNVVMPQMGESVAEGTVVRWIKRVGDSVDRDEPLFEISTDKVDAEIPSPAAGVLTEIRVKEGETVAVDSVVAVIGAAGDGVAVPGGSATRVETPVRAASDGAAAPRAAAREPSPAPDGDSRHMQAPTTGIADEEDVREEATQGAAEAETAAPKASGGETAADSEEERSRLRRMRSSPLVRRIAEEHRIDLKYVAGTGVGGRVTKQDILQHLERQSLTPAPAAEPGELDARSRAPVIREGDRVEIVPMTVMRRKIAEHMVLSRRTSAHVHSVFEIDFQRVSAIREEKKAEFERLGAKLTFMSFIAKAVCDALRQVPVVNASIDGDNIVYKKDIHLGIAVALENGLIVPVVKHADEKNLLGLSRAIADLAGRARSKQLKPEEVQGGTFTITNPGTFGTLFGMPIINQPQVAILGVGAIEKRVVVIDDAIHVRPRAYLSLGYDHRLVDGAVADQFMSHVKRGIEQFEMGT